MEPLSREGSFSAANGIAQAPPRAQIFRRILGGVEDCGPNSGHRCGSFRRHHVVLKCKLFVIVLKSGAFLLLSQSLAYFEQRSGSHEPVFPPAAISWSEWWFHPALPGSLQRLASPAPSWVLFATFAPLLGCKRAFPRASPGLLPAWKEVYAHPGTRAGTKCGLTPCTVGGSATIGEARGSWLGVGRANNGACPGLCVPSPCRLAPWGGGAGGSAWRSWGCWSQQCL